MKSSSRLDYSNFNDSTGNGAVLEFRDKSKFSLRKMGECEDDGEGKQIVKGNYVTTKHNQWTIIEKIGEGGYGSVYKVRNAENEEYALKIERRRSSRSRYKLEMEMSVLREARLIEKVEKRKHFTELIDKAKKKQFSFLVMTLLDECLSDIRKKRQPQIFTLGTTYAAAIQCLEALEELHNIGYIHRDVKPGNYAVGRSPKRGTIFVLDFGIARKFLNAKGELKAPREKVGFKGTVRYAPIDCHKNKELGTKHDIESWLYMVVDFGNKLGPNWKGEKDKKKIQHLKEHSRTTEGLKRLFDGIDETQFSKILSYLDGLTYADRPDYNYIYKLIELAASNANVSIRGQLDWETDDAKVKSPEVNNESRHRDVGNAESAYKDTQVGQAAIPSIYRDTRAAEGVPASGRMKLRAGTSAMDLPAASPLKQNSRMPKGSDTQLQLMPTEKRDSRVTESPDGAPFGNFNKDSKIENVSHLSPVPKKQISNRRRQHDPHLPSKDVPSTEIPGNPSTPVDPKAKEAVNWKNSKYLSPKHPDHKENKENVDGKVKAEKLVDALLDSDEDKEKKASDRKEAKTKIQDEKKPKENTKQGGSKVHQLQDKAKDGGSKMSKIQQLTEDRKGKDAKKTVSKVLQPAEAKETKNAKSKIGKPSKK